MKRCGVAWLCVVACLAAGGAAAQSLGDIAKKEQERQKTAKGTGKTYTDQDLSKLPPRPAAETSAMPAIPAPDQPAVTEAKPGVVDKQAPAAEEKGEAYWKGLLKDAQTQLERNRTQLAALQKQLSDFESVWIDRDDYAIRLRVEQQRTKALAEVERLKKEIDQGVKEIEKIREDARRQGIPPGWLR